MLCSKASAFIALLKATENHLYFLICPKTPVLLVLPKGICVHCFAQKHLYALLYPKESVFIALPNGICIHCFAQRHLYLLLCPKAYVLIALPKGICIHCFAQRHLYSLLCANTAVFIALRKGICIHCFVISYPCLRSLSTTKGHTSLRRLISTFVICILELIISNLQQSKFQFPSSHRS